MVGVTVIQVVWSAWAKPLSEGNTAQKGLDRPLSFIFEQSIGKLYWSNTREMIGMFGWLDTVTPMATTIFWLVAVGALVLLAIIAGTRRAAWAIGVTLALTYVVPVVIETARASSNNLVWHGRYTLPFAVGIPLLAGYTLRALEGTTLAIKRFAWWLVRRVRRRADPRVQPGTAPLHRRRQRTGVLLDLRTRRGHPRCRRGS